MTPPRADIFVSYTRADDAWVRRLVAALRVRWSVTWDQDIGIGAEWRAAIDAALDAATVVIVVWSARSSVAQYVLAEAGRANGRKALLPVCMEPIKPPDAFVHVNAADLSAWTDEVCPPALAATIEAWLARPRTPEPSVAQQVVAELARLGVVAQAGENGLARDTILQLAQRLKPDETLDFAQAVTEVRNAVAIALDLIRTGERGANEDAFVNAVLRRVAEKISGGRLDAAADELDAELTAIEERAQRSTVVLLERAIEVDTLRRDPDAAAERIARLAAAQHPDDREADRAMQIERWQRYYDEGDQRGINLSLEIAIAIARRATGDSATSDEAGAWYDRLGMALEARGERERDAARMKEAVAAYRAALERRPRDRVPLDWAETQDHLGAVLGKIGHWENGIARLEESVLAFRAALEERTRERAPLAWASTQANLGGTLRHFGERESGTAHLAEAVAAFQASLEVQTAEAQPVAWATTQNNLAATLFNLGEQESGTASLERSVTAFRAALRVFTRERTPMDWARTQQNLAGALTRLGERESGTARLEEAVAAFRAALEERTRERMPLGWAMTQSNLGDALVHLGLRESGTARLEEAVAACRAALEEATRDRMPFGWALATYNLGEALTRLGERQGGTAHLEEAAAVFRAVLEEWTAEREPLNHKDSKDRLDRVLALLAERRGGS